MGGGSFLTEFVPLNYRLTEVLGLACTIITLTEEASYLYKKAINVTSLYMYRVLFYITRTIWILSFVVIVCS